LILPSPEDNKVERGCPANSHKPFSRNDGPASKAAPYRGIDDPEQPLTPALSPSEEEREKPRQLWV